MLSAIPVKLNWNRMVKETDRTVVGGVDNVCYVVMRLPDILRCYLLVFFQRYHDHSNHG